MTFGKRGNADLPLFVFANGADPGSSRGIGLFLPNSPQNVQQTVGFDGQTGERLYSEDRRLQEWFQLGWERGPQIIVVARALLTGMLAPGRAKPNAIETLYQEVYVLFGSPDQILEAAKKIQQAGA